VHETSKKRLSMAGYGGYGGGGYDAYAGYGRGAPYGDERYYDERMAPPRAGPIGPGLGSARSLAATPEDAEYRVRILMREREEDGYCADCGTRAPEYLCLTLGSFVCSDCADVHRSMKRKVKAVLGGDLTGEDASRIESVGNHKCNKRFLFAWNPTDFPQPDPKNKQNLKEFIWLKYEGSWTKKNNPNASDPSGPPKDLKQDPMYPPDPYYGHEPPPAYGYHHPEPAYYDAPYASYAPPAPRSGGRDPYQPAPSARGPAVPPTASQRGGYGYAAHPPAPHPADQWDYYQERSRGDTALSSRDGRKGSSSKKGKDDRGKTSRKDKSSSRKSKKHSEDGSEESEDSEDSERSGKKSSSRKRDKDKGKEKERRRRGRDSDESESDSESSESSNDRRKSKKPSSKSKKNKEKERSSKSGKSSSSKSAGPAKAPSIFESIQRSDAAAGVNTSAMPGMNQIQTPGLVTGQLIPGMPEPTMTVGGAMPLQSVSLGAQIGQVVQTPYGMGIVTAQGVVPMQGGAPDLMTGFQNMGM